jgi:hypothetical protein
MSIIKKLLLASAMLILSVNVFAGPVLYGNYTLHNDHKTVTTATVASRNKAYDLGLKKLNEMKAKSSLELAREFVLFLDSAKEINSVTLDDDGYITIDESMNNRGELVYTAKVHLSCSYSKAN